MGRISAELSEPWGIMVASIIGGVAWAALGPVGLGIGAAVYGVKVVAGAAMGEAKPRLEKAPGPLRPAYGTPAAVWLKRADTAVRSLQDMARGAVNNPTDSAAAHAAEEAVGILDTIKHLAGQSAAVASALATADSAGLDDEAADLRRRADADPSDASAQQSADAVGDRMAVRDRLRKAQTALEGRLQSSALGLEGLVARIAELKATTASVGALDPSTADLASLTTEVEGLRQGLADAEQVARKALGSPA
jgi:hypothetical protein